MTAHAHHPHGHHGHHDHHHHGHDEGPGRALAIGIALNLAFVIIEWGFGLSANSLALLADATHNLGDVLGLVFAWGAARLARRAPSARFTYGFGASSILAALANALLLVAVTGAWCGKPCCACRSRAQSKVRSSSASRSLASWSTA